MDQTLLLFVGAIVLVVIVLAMIRRNSGSEGVPIEVHRHLQHQHEELQKTLETKEQELRQAAEKLSRQEQIIAHQKEQIMSHGTELEKAIQRMKLEFEQLASRLFEEKSQRFTEQNAQQLQLTLTPLRDKIREFQENLERKFSDETRDKASLRKEIEQLVSLNQQLSQDARNLTAALKGQSKVQGDWGEFQLEVLLENIGLKKGEHFVAQSTFTDDDGQTKRPDFLVRLPNQRHLVIDAKVSLTAFERFFNAEDPDIRRQHLSEHVNSLRRHVQNLSVKNYTMLHQINSPDYIILFVPLDSAVSAAIQADPNLLQDALRSNVVIATSTTLAAILRVVAHLWRQEKQNRSAEEIARQSGLLYDKFVAFVEDLRQIGTRLDQAQDAYSHALRKLTTGTRRGDTLIARAERLRELGAKTTRQLPPDLFEDIEDEEGNSTT